MHRQRMAQEEKRWGRRNAAREAERLQRPEEAARRKEAAAARRARETPQGRDYRTAMCR